LRKLVSNIKVKPNITRNGTHRWVSDAEEELCVRLASRKRLNWQKEKTALKESMLAINEN